MADEEDVDDLENEEGEGGETGKKKGLIIAIAVLLLIGGAAAAYFLGLFGGDEPAEGEGKTADDVMLDEEGNPIEAKVTYYELPEFLVNLSTSTNQTSFLKMTVTLELPSERDMQIAQENLPALQDHFNSYLRDLRASDLSGSAGMYRLREELLARANKTLAPGRVNNILFTKILVQ